MGRNTMDKELNDSIVSKEPSKAQHGVLTYTSMIYHRESPMDEATSIPIQFSRNLNTQEQLFGPRKYQVGESWEPLDFGWLKDKPISMIIIKNLEGKFDQIVPTLQQRVEASYKALVVAYEDSDLGFDIPIGESLPFVSRDPSKLRIRCLLGIAKYTLIAIPG